MLFYSLKESEIVAPEAQVWGIPVPFAARVNCETEYE